MSKLYLDEDYCKANNMPSIKPLPTVKSVELCSDPGYVEIWTTREVHRVRLAIFVKVEV